MEFGFAIQWVSKNRLEGTLDVFGFAKPLATASRLAAQRAGRK
jgi:hypothetical protein